MIQLPQQFGKLLLLLVKALLQKRKIKMLMLRFILANMLKLMVQLRLHWKRKMIQGQMGRQLSLLGGQLLI